MSTVRFFITGAAGFIGSNLVHQILGVLPDAKVLSYDALTYAGKLENLEGALDNPNHEFIQGDIGDPGLVHAALEHFRPDVIIHLAAETHVDRSIAAAQPFIQTNIVGQTNLLMAAQDYFEKRMKDRSEIFHFIHISTDEVFGALGADDQKFSESTPYDPRSPYSASKAASDHLVRAWQHTYELPAIILNCSNNYGPRQYPEKLIPVVITKALSKQDIPVYGQGQNIRDWIHVDDYGRAILCAAEKGVAGQSYCIGGGNEWRNIDLVRFICKTLDELHPRKDGESYEEQIQFVTDRPGHDFRYAINSAKAREELDWQPRISFEQGLQETIKWYLERH
ncbi:MAG: dTDP-glucose 4,6-dehydratase [Alphaproteobacteria bacterium]|nr:dTDP-glucose 4,6-dehydratase [Alphaproteobacteria bacterium]